MTLALSKLLKSAYRKEPISGFIFLSGTVDALLGAFNERWTLLSLGIVLVIFSLTVRWLQKQKKPKKSLHSPIVRRYLNPSLSPNQSTRQPLPELKRKSYYR
jgi:hypothetical protein